MLLGRATERDLDDFLHLWWDPGDVLQGLTVFGVVELSLGSATERKHFFQHGLRSLTFWGLPRLFEVCGCLERPDTSGNIFFRCGDSAEQVKGRCMWISQFVGWIESPDTA